EALRELDDPHGIRPQAHAALRTLLPRCNDASDTDERATTDHSALLQGFALGIGQLRLLLRRLEVERDCAFLRFLPRQMDVLLASEVRVRDSLNGLLETLRVILFGSCFGLVLTIGVFALRIGLRQLGITS